MILQEYLEIGISPKNLQYYKNLGYNVKNKEKILIKNQDVQQGSRIKEKRICDNCGKEIYRTRRAICDTFRIYNKDLCVECSDYFRLEKTKSSNIEKYGVEFPMQSEEIKQKIKKSNLEHYGCEYSFKNPKINEMARKSFQEKYGTSGVLATNIFKEKVKQTNLQKYGCENVFGSDDVKNKIKNTILDKYGVEYISQSEDIKNKIRKSFEEKGIVKTSKPQLELFEKCKILFPEYKIYLNLSESYFSLDIALIKEHIKIDVEYDGYYWHKETKQKDYIRDKILQKRGYKILRIRSGILLPENEELINAIQLLNESTKNFVEIKLSDWG